MPAETDTMPNPNFLRVVFPMTDNLKYSNPESWRCLDFEHCPYWQPAHSVSWVNLPAHKFAMFFETRNCTAEDKFVYISADGLRSGINKFRSPQAIRSMMVGENQYYKHKHVSTHFNCPYNSHSKITSSKEVVAVGSSVNTSYEVACDGLVADGGISSNWYDAILDTWSS